MTTSSAPRVVSRVVPASALSGGRGSPAVSRHASLLSKMQPLAGVDEFQEHWPNFRVAACKAVDIAAQVGQLAYDIVRVLVAVLRGRSHPFEPFIRRAL